jgi:hypothetical protein
MYRINESIKRIRQGDISFRVTLRKGDHLTDIAEELNKLLDWLNANPPQGVVRGGDTVKVQGKPSPTPQSAGESPQVTMAGTSAPTGSSTKK